jgi:hypothetical protein
MEKTSLGTATVDTYGGPTTYDFVIPKEDIIIDGPIFPPDRPKKKKQKKEKKKKKKKKKPLPLLSTGDYVLIITGLIAASALLLLYPSSTPLTPPIVIPLNTKFGTNTTSIVATPEAVKAILPTIADSLKHYAAQKTLVCMHHLQHSQPLYRICCLRNRRDYYMMINPRLIGHSKNVSSYIENSIAYAQPVTRQRYDRVSIEWDDDIYAIFKSEQSLLLQMALDEFKGEMSSNAK